LRFNDSGAIRANIAGQIYDVPETRLWWLAFSLLALFVRDSQEVELRGGQATNFSA
jgi:hypothetical protein